MRKNSMDELGERGDWYFIRDERMGIKYGEGEWDVVILPIHAKYAVRWEWNGDMDSPTLSPSILVYGGGSAAAWHGYLRDGVLIDA